MYSRLYPPLVPTLWTLDCHHFFLSCIVFSFSVLIFAVLDLMQLSSTQLEVTDVGVNTSYVLVNISN